MYARRRPEAIRYCLRHVGPERRRQPRSRCRRVVDFGPGPPLAERRLYTMVALRRCRNRAQGAPPHPWGLRRRAATCRHKRSPAETSLPCRPSPTVCCRQVAEFVRAPPGGLRAEVDGQGNLARCVQLPELSAGNGEERRRVFRGQRQPIRSDYGLCGNHVQIIGTWRSEENQAHCALHGATRPATGGHRSIRRAENCSGFRFA